VMHGMSRDLTSACGDEEREIEMVNIIKGEL
jgi:hypothetical protein